VNGIHTLPQSYHGIFALMGPGVVPGRTLDTVSVLDVAPTIAYLLGLPVARNLPGRVVTEAFTPAHLAAHPIRTVPSW
jgi:predicted AlkP superfamily phosphohydrolase/phosphomutase